MPKGHTATKPKPTPPRAGARSSAAAGASRAAPKMASKMASSKTVMPKAAAPKPAASKTVVAKAAAPKVPPAVHKKNGDKGMASKSAVATKAKVNDKELPDKEKDTATPETPDSPLPLLDLSDAAVKKMIKQAKKRGYVTHEQLNAVLPSEEVSSDQIEDIYSMLNEMGINVVEQEEGADDEEPKPADAEEDDDDSDGELVEAKPKALATVEKKEPSERTDDPVRMYLREMGSVELLSREGEIAIAKRIEAGREAMIAGLCESPLTFQAIIIWRDELNDGKVFLRDIIDLEATYAGPEAKNNSGQAASGDGASPFAQTPQQPPPPAAPPAPPPFKPAGMRPPQPAMAQPAPRVEGDEPVDPGEA